MKRSLSLAPLLLLFVLVACSLTPAPTAEGIDSTMVETAAGFAFLPPIGNDVDTAGFFAGAELRYEIHRLEGGVPAGMLSPVFATADGSIKIEDDHYHAVWKVRDTVRAHPGATAFRVMAWRDDAGAGSCLNETRDAADPCLLGYFDARIRSGKKQHEDGVLELTRNQSLPIKSFLTGDAAAPTSLGELFPLVPTSDPAAPFDPAGPNCMAHEFSVPSQGLNALGAGLNALGAGLNALGAVGGLILFEPTSTPPDPADNPIRLMPSLEVGAFVGGIPGASNPAHNAAILIVDDFGDDPATPWEDPYYFLDEGFFDLADVSAAGLEALVADGEFSHGALVLHNVLGTLAGAGFDITAYADPTVRILARSADDALPIAEKTYVMVAAVHSGGLDTDQIAGRIENALAAINFYNDAYDLGVERVAINMSFVVIPCEVLEDFQASGIATFEEYVAALALENGALETFRDELTALLLTPNAPDTDPLLLQIETCSSGPILFSRTGSGPGPDERVLQIDFPGEGSFWPYFGNLIQSPVEFDISLWDYCSEASPPSIVYVASAGNFGQDFPLYPAAWPLVTSVASQDAVVPSGYGDARSSFSNAGEVMAPGALYELSSGPDWALAYAGTSFAAPVVSVYTALDLTQAVPLCALIDRSWLAHGIPPADVALPEAVAAYCAAPPAF